MVLRSCSAGLTHCEVECLRLLLVGSPLGDVQLAHVRLGGHGLDGFGGAAVLEGVGDIKVLHRQHVLQRLHGGVQGLSHLHRCAKKRIGSEAVTLKARLRFCTCRRTEGQKVLQFLKPFCSFGLGQITSWLVT